MQVVLGPVADMIAVEMREAMVGTAAPSAPDAPQVHPSSQAVLPPPLLAAFGGSANVAAAAALHGRMRIELADLAAIDREALAAIAPRGIEIIGNAVHILIPPQPATS